MRFLLATTATGAIAAFLTASPAAAETVISTAVTTPQKTSVAGDIRITSAGSVKPASGVAVTIDSNNGVRNEGTIAIRGANGATGVLADPNLTGNITNTGTITIDEDYTATDSDKDGDLDGPFAQGAGRFGIHVLAGGTHTGNVLNSGTITVEGNQSAGIAIDSALAGSLTQSGTINVLGNDSVGIRVGSVTGNVLLSGGTVVARGQNAVGVQLGGDIGGALVIQGGITATGYRHTTAPADPSKLDADDLLQGGPAVLVAGNVAGGILLDARPADLDPNDADEDDDGIADASEGRGSISSFGAAPAVRIGSALQDVAIGPVASSTSGFGIILRGDVAGSGVYKGVNATAIEIGGLGKLVTVAGGLNVSGNVTAKAVEANATAIRVGAGTSVPLIANSGTISAEAGGSATSSAQAILIEAGASVPTVKNSGTILGIRSGSDGTAAAIVDKSGTLSLVENSGVIGVADSAALGSKAIALDLRANTAGASVRQLAPASGTTAPRIDGDILFGTGNDVLQLLAGSVNGTADFGGGSDILQLAGGASFNGRLLNSAGLAVAVGGGSTLNVANTGIVNLASLTTGAGANVGVTLNTLTNAITQYAVSGAATFAENTKILVNLENVGSVSGTYKIITAATLTGANNLSSGVALLPFLYESSLITSTPGEVSLKVRVKTADELGLNRSESAILGAALDAADADKPIAGLFLKTADSATLKSTLQQLMPDHSGGAFETATKGSRLAAGMLAGPQVEAEGAGGLDIWLQQVAWGASKSIGDTSSYNLTSWGAVGGIEQSLGGFGSVGLTGAFYFGRDAMRDNDLTSNHYEGGVYWRAGLGPLRAFARATAGQIKFDGTRRLSATLSGADVKREADGEWTGRVYSGVAGVSFDARAGRLLFRPSAVLEHFTLREGRYTETGGGDAFNLTVGKRRSSETAANGNVAIGYDLLGLTPESAWMRVEVEGGWRQIFAGELGDTVAQFKGGQPFTLAAEERSSGLRAALRLTGGGSGMLLTGELSGEEQQGKASIGGRIGLGFAF